MYLTPALRIQVRPFTIIVGQSSRAEGMKKKNIPFPNPTLDMVNNFSLEFLTEFFPDLEKPENKKLAEVTSSHTMTSETAQQP